MIYDIYNYKTWLLYTSSVLTLGLPYAMQYSLVSVLLLKEHGMNVKEIPNQRKRYELVAPDGGWGYMIWIALTINMISLTSFASCIGMMYNDIFKQLKMDSASITLLNGIGSMSISIAGFITAPLLECLSMRKLGVISAIIYNLGTFGIVFVNSRELFFFSNAILQSFGNGILLNISFTMLNQYFVKKRMLCLTVSQTVTATLTLFTPQFVKWSADEYGYRGTLILITGIFMQVFIGVVLMQPVEWHLKKIEIDIISEDKNSDIKNLLKLDEAKKEKCNTLVPTVKQSETVGLLSVPAEKKELSDTVEKEDIKKNSVLRNIFKDFFDIPFLKSYLLSNASVGLAISAFSEVTFILLLPQALYFMEWAEGEVAWAISLNNFGDVVMKVIFILFNTVLHKIGTSEIYIIGLIMAFFSRLGMLWSDDRTVMLVFITIMGMSKSVLILFIPLVIGDSVDKEKFTAAMGIFMLLYGTVFLTLGPIIGAIRDLTNSYGTAFYIITSCYGIVAMFWVIELLYKKNKHKRVKKIKNDDSA